ncbi:MAG: hypothetical protein WB622_11910, partial [Acidobacteriaceae bacterium]
MVISSRIALAGALWLCCLSAFGQKSSSGGSGSSSAGSSSDSSNAPGFSIETEMFTYRAVEQNSEAIACDIARSLYGGGVQDAPQGSHVPCVVSSEGQAPQGIVLISGGSTLVQDFQIWRADMAAMDSLRSRAAAVCVGAPKGKEEGAQPSEGGASSRGLGSTVLGLLKSTAPGQMIGGAGAVMGMFSSNQSVSSVVGTVHDPALMNEVARQLRALGIQVLIPELYSPNGLSSPDPSHSPYLQNMNELITAYDGCLKLKGDDVASVSDEIKQFLTAAMASPPPEQKPAGGSGSGGGSGTGPVAASEPHLAAVLAADAVARKLSISDDPAAAANKTWQHLLWVKALESGGSVTRTSNLFGTKVQFGGGAVDTFAVFRLDGDLVCSGNVY